MNAQSVFLGSLFVMLICNLLLFSANPIDYLNSFYNNGLISILVLVLVAVVLGGINVLGTGLTGASVKLLFSVSVMLMMLFEINIPLSQYTPPNSPIQDAANQIVFGLQSSANAIVNFIMRTPQGIQAENPQNLGIGFGLLSRIYNVFLFSGDLWHIGLILTGLLGVMFIGSVLIMIVEGHGE